jgi:NADH:ubiquinone oxidoreductase subunit E
MEITLIACIKDRATGKPACAGRGSIAIINQIEAEIKKRGLPVPVERIRCLGECAKGPNMRIAPGGRFLYGITEEKIPEVLATLEQVLNSDEPAA